jgi:hypothetical protein
MLDDLGAFRHEISRSEIVHQSAQPSDGNTYEMKAKLRLQVWQ